MRVAQKIRLSEEIAAAWHGAERGRYMTGSGPRIIFHEPRPWWFTERISLGWVQFWGALGGFLAPILLFVVAGSSAEGAVLAVPLGLFLLAIGGWVFAETKAFTEAEIAGDGARLAGGAVIVAGWITALVTGLLFVAGFIATVLFFAGIAGAAGDS